MTMKSEISFSARQICSRLFGFAFNLDVNAMRGYVFSNIAATPLIEDASR